ncbi:hypothetical protein DUT91_24310 [Phyllobacterium salinisoli]|uniref:Uncharacterized protein n=1 Tax=Phyllobacterium salinisoli TaxID=1899321 RepID=A0A368K0C2_9HYPH|nr:hypothetical protein DUT91_24310 [Phyllobacterium salinisoli]
MQIHKASIPFLFQADGILELKILKPPIIPILFGPMHLVTNSIKFHMAPSFIREEALSFFLQLQARNRPARSQSRLRSILLATRRKFRFMWGTC